MNDSSESDGDYELSSIRPRELDSINAFVFCYHLLRGYRDQLERNAAAKIIRSSLEPLEFEFQTTRGRCPYHFVAMTVPDHRDEMASRLWAAGIKARTFWEQPLVTAFGRERRLSKFPNTRTLTEDGLQLPLVEMSEADVRLAVDIIEEIAPKNRTGRRIP